MMDDISNTPIFVTHAGKTITYQDLMRDIYENSSDTRDNIQTLVEQMVSLIEKPEDAIVLMGHITDMVNARIKNDDLLVKVAAILSRILQKSVSPSAVDAGWEISDAEKKQLLAEANQMMDDK